MTVEIVTNHNLQRIEAGCARIVRVLSGCESTLATDWVLPLTRREPEDALDTTPTPIKRERH